MRRLAVLIVFVVCAGRPALAQPPSGVLKGAVSTQGRAVPLPGAELVVLDASKLQVTQALSGEDGGFRFDHLPGGKYQIVASLPGFVGTAVDVVVVADRPTEVSIDLPIAGISQQVDVVAIDLLQPVEGTLATSDHLSAREIDQFAPTGGLQASLRLLASVIELPGGLSIKGGRPSQAGVQLGSSTLVDTANGLNQMSLPDDAIDSVTVLSNPYAVEFGRFSSGLVVIQTRRAGDAWKLRLNNPDPTFRTERGSPAHLYGVGYWAPRLEVGGPLIDHRLFVEQTAQFRYSASDVPSLPPDLLRTAHAFSSFTRIDANLSTRQTLVSTVGLFPGVSRQATLGTFTPPQATVDLYGRANQIAMSHRVLWSDTLFSETTVHAHEYRTDVVPQGSAPMELLADTTAGNFFNQQHRETATQQIVETVSGSRNGRGGEHLIKLGLDLLHNAYAGRSISRPVLIERADGTLARRLDFAGPTSQFVESTDTALFAQDRFQPNASWYLEFGARLDRDGILGRFNATPRVGTAVRLSASGNMVLRGGFGLFYERTPSTAGVFDEFEDALDTRFASDGVTLLGSPVALVHQTRDLQTPRSRTWDIGYDYRLGMWSFHAAALQRQGSHELIVNPVLTQSTGQLELTSTGRSSYRGAEVGVRVGRTPSADLSATYAWSSSQADLNTLTGFFDSVLAPVIGANAYAPSTADVPHRLTARGRAMPAQRWLLIGIFDWRTGLPYSVLNETLDFVGPRNRLRFPNYVRLEAGVERRVKILKFQPWLGVRVWNALNAFNPTDVQANLGSPAFGSFYNSEYRQFRIQVRFER